MKKKSKLIIAITLMVAILILIGFTTFNGKEKQKNLASKPMSEDSNTKKDENEKNSSDKKENEGSKEDGKNDLKEDVVNNPEEKENKENVSNNSDLNKSNDTNTEKTNYDNSEVNSSNTTNNSNTNNGSNTTNDSNITNGSNTTNDEKSPVKDQPDIPVNEEQPVEKYVTMSITSNTILNNMDKVSEGKKAIIPSNGVILGEVKVKIEDGDTVFDILKRETRKNRIHMDFVESPLYGSAYIKGIANIYEFDAGDLSGWMYSVNGVFPGYGASNSEVKNGDVIKWQYTCDLGRDLGNEF